MFKHIICTLFAKNGVLYRANGYINFGIFTCKVCQKDQLLSKTSVASQCPGRESKQQLSAYTWRQTLQYTCTYAIFSSKIRINLALRCYMQMYQWTLILRVSFSSSQSTCMPCVLHLMYQISLSCCLQNDGYKCKESCKCLLCCSCVWSIKDGNKSILIFIEKWISKKIIDI